VHRLAVVSQSIHIEVVVPWRRGLHGLSHLNNWVIIQHSLLDHWPGVGGVKPLSPIHFRVFIQIVAFQNLALFHKSTLLQELLPDRVGGFLSLGDRLLGDSILFIYLSRGHRGGRVAVTKNKAFSYGTAHFDPRLWNVLWFKKAYLPLNALVHILIFGSIIPTIFLHRFWGLVSF